MSCHLLSGSFFLPLSAYAELTQAVQGVQSVLLLPGPSASGHTLSCGRTCPCGPTLSFLLNCTQVLSLMTPGPAKSPILSSPSHESDPLGFCCSSLPVGQGLKIFGDFAAPFRKVEVENTNHPC